MEIFAALLTALFAWLCLLSWSTGARTRAAHNSGKLLLSIGWPDAHRRWVAGLLAALPMCGYSSLLLFVSDYEVSGILFWWALMMSSFVTAAARRYPGLEFRERGILAGSILLPWEAIKYCKWSRSKYNLFIQLHQNVRSFKVPSRQVDAASAVLGRFVVLRNTEGEVLNPEFAPREGAAVAATDGGRRSPAIPLARWQYDLRTLLLLLLAASSVFGWMAIRREALRPEREALAALEQSDPKAWNTGSHVINLDFFSPNALTDDDLIHLKNFTHLESIDLSYAPITDAGLVHLYNLQQLERIELYGTNVTNAGAEALQQALPDTMILH